MNPRLIPARSSARRTNSFFPRCRRGLLAQLVLTALLFAARLADGATTIKIEIGAAGHKFAEDLQVTVPISWNSIPGVLYTIQSSTNVSENGGNNENWIFGSALVADSTNSRVEFRVTAAPQFFRIAAPAQITGVEPTFVDASNTNSLLYIFGQFLPDDATVFVNGVAATSSPVGSNGVWRTVCCLPPGEPVIGSIVVVENGTSNVVATFNPQIPVIVGTNLTAEQLQGPAEVPPAEPVAGVAIPKFLDITTKAQQAAEKADVGTIRSGLGSLGFNPPPGVLAGVAIPKFLDITHKAKKAAEKADVGAIRAGIMNHAASAAGGNYFKVTLDGDPLKEETHFCPSSGEVQVEATDLAIPGRGLDFAWTRTYCSRTGTNTAQGHGWDFSYNVSLKLFPNDAVVLRPGNGRVDTFYRNGTNGWSRDEYFAEIRDLDQDGLPDVMVFADTGKWVFRPLNDGTPAAGKLSQIVDRNGNTIRCEYDDLTGLLVRVVDTLDRTNVIAYDAASGNIESVADFSGRTARYEYDGNGDLVTCVSPPVTGTPTGNDFPGGITNRYTYTTGQPDARLNHNLTSCIDGKGQAWLSIFYAPQSNPENVAFDTVNNVVRGGVYLEHFRRFRQTPSPTNGFAIVKTIHRDAADNVIEYFCDSRGRCVRLLEYTGRAPFSGAPVTEDSNRPTGKLRADDPAFFERGWRWNADSLCTSTTTLGDGNGRINKVRMIYERDFNPTVSPRKKGDCRVVRQYSDDGLVDTDGDGLGDTSELAWHFDYDPRFGSRGKIVCNYIRREKSGIDDWNTGDWAIYNGRVKVQFPWDREGGGGKASRWVRKGWDGTIKGNLRGPRQSTSLDGSYRASGDTTPPTYSWMADLDKPDVVFGTGLGRTDMTAVNGRLDYLPDEFADFVISATDPRGVVSTATYNANGKQTQWEPHKNPGLDSPVIEFAYNTHGQLTAITNAADANGRRSVTRFVYGDDPFTVPVEPPVPFAFMVVEDEGGLQLTNRFAYDERGNLTLATSPAGVPHRFVWNTLADLVRVETPTNLTAGCATDFIYDANGNVVQCVTELRDENDSPTGAKTDIVTVDGLNRVTEVVEQVSAAEFVTNRFFYNGNDQVIAVHSPLAVIGVDPHAALAFEYDERGLLFREVGAPGSGNSPTNQYDYNAVGRMRLLRAPDYLRTTTFTHDGFGRPDSVTDLMGNVITCRYDRDGRLVFTRVMGERNDVPGTNGNVRLAESRYEYNNLDQCTRWRDAYFDVNTQAAIGDGERTTTFSYAPNGQCKSVTDDNGRTTSFAYDTAGQLSSVTGDGAKTVTAVFRDRAGNVTQTTQSDRSDIPGPMQTFQNFFSYDSRNRCIADWDNVGNTNRYAYDSQGNCVRYTDPRGAVIRETFDLLGRKTKTFQDMNDNDIEEAADVVVTQTWDENSRIIAATDDNTNTTYYAYNWMDCIVSVSSPDGTSSSLVWSPRSNLILEQDANGTVVSNSFDLLDRCIRRDITPGPGVAATTTFETFGYDGLSQMVAATNNVSITITPRDSFGNCMSSTQNGRTTTYTYDGEGNCLSMTYPGGLVVLYTYNGLNDVSTVSALSGGLPPAVVTAAFAYDGPGRVGTITRGNNVGTRLNWNGAVNPPNAAGDFGSRRVRRVNHQVTVGGAVIDQRITAFDRNQNRILRAQTTAFSPVNEPATNVWSHDALNRATEHTLFRANSMASKSYGLDGNGNRQTVLSNGVLQLYFMDPTPLPDPADFQMDQYTQTPFAAQTFDENGNLTSRASTTAQLVFEYDYANRLVSVTDMFTGAPVPVASYAYDPMSRRISKTVYPTVPALPVTTEFVYGGPDDCDDDVIEARRFGVVGEAFVLDGSRSSDDGVVKTWSWRQTGGPFVMLSGGQVYYFHKDDLGSVLALTDAGGNVVERYDYDDFGLPEFLTSDGLPLATNASPAGNPFLFHGWEWEPETGLHLWKEFSPAQDQLKSNPRHRAAGGYVDPQVGRPVNGMKIDGGMPNRISMNVTAPKQTQGATFGERVNAGLHAAGGRLFRPGTRGSGIDYNSSRSNKTSGLTSPGGGGGGVGGTASLRTCCEYHRRQSELVGHVTLMK